MSLKPAFIANYSNEKKNLLLYLNLNLLILSMKYQLLFTNKFFIFLIYFF